MNRWIVLLVALAGCILFGESKDSESGSTPLTTSDADTDADSDTDADTDTDTDTDPVAEMCARWNADRADMAEGAWTGSVGSCTPGTISQNGVDTTLRLVNLYRWLAELPPVGDDPAKNTRAQACSLIMDANDSLSHSPPNNWDCWTQLGDDGAGSSNIATTPAVAAIDLYMVDYGNEDTLGHRRWILANSLGPIGVGSTSSYSCLEVIGGSGNAGAAWTAFPSPGPFPVQAMTLGGWAGVDDEGWHVQSDSIDLSSATVTVTRQGQPLAVTTRNLPGGYGSSYALSFVPNGWTGTPGVYQIAVGGVASPINYEVEMVDCGAP